MGHEPDRSIARFAADHFGVFTHRHACSAGISQDQIKLRLALGRWEHLHEDVYRLAGTREEWKGRLLAACWAGGFRAVASHRSAAALWELPGGRRTVAEITCPRWRRARHDGLVVHESKAVEAVDRAEIHGIPVATAERVLLDLGAVCHPTVVEMALDAAESRGLVSIASMRSTLDRLGRSGRNGVGVLRRLLRSRGAKRRPPESAMETRLIQVLRRNGFPEPVPQYEIRSSGAFVARVDAAYPQWHVAIEYDSAEHHAGSKSLARDSARRNRILAAGWTTVTATLADIRNGGTALCAAIRGARALASQEGD